MAVAETLEESVQRCAVRAQTSEAPRALFISYPAADCGWVNSFNSKLKPLSLCADGDHAEHCCSMEELLPPLASLKTGHYITTIAFAIGICLNLIKRVSH